MSATNIPVTVQRMEVAEENVDLSNFRRLDAASTSIRAPQFSSIFGAAAFRALPFAKERETETINSQSNAATGSAVTPSTAPKVDATPSDIDVTARNDELFSLLDALTTLGLDDPEDPGEEDVRAVEPSDAVSTRIASPSAGQVNTNDTEDSDYLLAILLAEEERQLIIDAEVARYWQTAPEPVDYSLTFDDLVSRGYIHEDVLARIEDLDLNLERALASQPSESSESSTPRPRILDDLYPSDPTKNDDLVLTRDDIDAITAPILDPHLDPRPGQSSSSKGKCRQSEDPIIDFEPSVPYAFDVDLPPAIFSAHDLPPTPTDASNKKGKRRAIYSLEDLQQAPSHPLTVLQVETPSPPVPNLRSCGICWEECLDVNQFVQNSWSSSHKDARFGLELTCSGGHYYCVTCIREYIQGQLETPVTGKGGATAAAMKCPECPRSDTDMGWAIGDDVAERVLDQELIDGWHMRKILASISEFYCPNPTCSIPIEAPELDDVTMAECPMCHVAMCFQCRSSWHSGLTCEEFKSAKDTSPENRMVYELAKANKWRRCPSCKMIVERSQDAELSTVIGVVQSGKAVAWQTVAIGRMM
ncbi:hypothetical protein FRB96_008671 [Tulasnella sp. 330]|nr:hypothetical protein FRB96_008671 [Tulasnella sp. 330]